MAPDPADVPRTTPCPACGAALRPGSPWCTLCYADLRPATPAAAMPAGVPTTVPGNAAYGSTAPDPLTQPILDFLAAPADQPAPQVAVPAPRKTVPMSTWPCAACGNPNPLSASECVGCGAGFLAGITTRPSLVLPVVGDLSRLSRAQRLWAAAGIAFALALLVAVIVAVLPGSTRPTPSDPDPVLPTSAPLESGLTPTPAP